MIQPMREKFRLEDKVNNLLSYWVLFSKLYIKGVTGEGEKKSEGIQKYNPASVLTLNG